MSNLPLITVVVLNWNNYEDSARCIRSIQNCGYSNLDIIVVDNASPDDSGSRLERDFPGFELLRNSENVGFSRGCNVGIRRALQNGECKYVFLLNNDAELVPGGLEIAVRAAEAHSGIGLVGGKILNSAATRVIWSAGGTINRWLGRANTRGSGEIDSGQYDIECDTEFVTGAMMLIKRVVLENVGLLPEEYFFGVEEWDYSLTVRRAGFRLRYVPALVAYHEGDGSHWNYDPKFVYNFYRNKLIFQEKHVGPLLFPLVRMLLRLYGQFIFDLKQKRMTRKHSPDRIVAIDQMKYALQCALRDHRRTPLDESQLNSFSRELDRKFPRAIDVPAG